MFIQVIRGRVKDPDGVRREMERWHSEIAPGAQGWLGYTAGITDDGEVVAVVRFESEEAARTNSDRPEQSSWWESLSQNLEGDAAFFDSNDVELFLDGGSDRAGFVQVIHGRAKDRDRLRELFQGMSARIQNFRPDVIGGTIAWHGSDRFTETVYFTSEEEARQGEKQAAESAPPEYQEWQTLVEDLSFADLRDPWMASR